jgi:hypothetical protein
VQGMINPADRDVNQRLKDGWKLNNYVPTQDQLNNLTFMQRINVVHYIDWRQAYSNWQTSVTATCMYVGANIKRSKMYNFSTTNKIAVEEGACTKSIADCPITNLN